MALLAAAASLTTGCGGDEPTEAEYVAGLDEACLESYDVDAGGEFTQALLDLEPPSELAEAHEELVERVGNEPDPGESLETTLEQLEGIRSTYEELGSAECEALAQESIDAASAAAPES